MSKSGRRYRLTAAGIRALESERSVPEWFRAILGVFHGDMTANEVLSSMSSYLRRETLTWLGQLDTLGFVEQVVPAEPGTASAEVTPDFGDNAVKVDGSLEVRERKNQRRRSRRSNVTSRTSRGLTLDAAKAVGS
jgi:hypothetical protein